MAKVVYIKETEGLVILETKAEVKEAVGKKAGSTITYRPANA